MFYLKNTDMKNLIILFVVFTTGCAAQNQRIRELQTQSTANGNYYIVVDAGGWARARKMTLTTAQSLVVNNYEGADSVTRANAGLSTSGTYVFLTGSNYLTASDFAALGLAGNINNATFILDSVLYDFLNGSNCYSVCLDTVRCGTGGTYFECNINTDSTVTTTRIRVVDTSAVHAILDASGDDSILVRVVGQDDYAASNIGVDNQGIGSGMILIDDSIGHGIDISESGIGNSIRMTCSDNRKDTAVFINYSASTGTNNTGIAIAGGSGKNIGVSVTGGAAADTAFKFTSPGAGNDIGFLFKQNSPGNDTGLVVYADVAANFGGDVYITAGRFIQSDMTLTSAGDSLPQVQSENIVFMDYAGSIDIRGFRFGSTGQVVHLVNKQTGNNVVIKNDAYITSLAGNKIRTGTGADVTITNEGGATFVFDGSIWYMISVQQ
jgi:hypothetical protein